MFGYVCRVMVAVLADIKVRCLLRLCTLITRSSKADV